MAGMILRLTFLDFTCPELYDGVQTKKAHFAVNLAVADWTGPLARGEAIDFQRTTFGSRGVESRLQGNKSNPYNNVHSRTYQDKDMMKSFGRLPISDDRLLALWPSSFINLTFSS
jgi:hypothetical protein